MHVRLHSLWTVFQVAVQVRLGYRKPGGFAPDLMDGTRRDNEQVFSQGPLVI